MKAFILKNFEYKDKLILSCQRPFVFFAEEVIKLLSVNLPALLLKNMGCSRVSNNSTEIRS